MSKDRVIGLIFRWIVVGLGIRVGGGRGEGIVGFVNGDMIGIYIFFEGAGFGDMVGRDCLKVGWTITVMMVC